MMACGSTGGFAINPNSLTRRLLARGTTLALCTSLTAAASASDVAAGAALRLPEPASQARKATLEEAIFKPLIPYALDEVPVRLPADQGLTPQSALHERDERNRAGKLPSTADD